MFFPIVLIFSGAVCIYAQRQHELCHTYGCFESGDTQISVTADGDEVYYADFKKEILIWEYKVPAIAQVPHAYGDELYYRALCSRDLLMFKPEKSAPKTTEAPEILIYPKEEVIKDEENTLICFIDHFFPPNITIKWTKNEVELKMEDPLIRCLSNPDGTFNVLSTLDFVPDEGDIYSCTVEYAAQEEAKTTFWEVHINEASIGPVVFLGLGLSLGLLGFAAGTFFFVKGKHYQSVLVG